MSDKVKLTLQDLQILAATAERNGTSRNFPEVALQWAAGAQAEIERLRAALAKANEQAERFERGWYLRGDALEVAVRQNEHDMLMTGEELRACRAALGA